MYLVAGLSVLNPELRQRPELYHQHGMMTQFKVGT
jgi:hypothetical protein